MAAKTKGEGIASLLFLQVTLHVLLNLTFPNSLCFLCVSLSVGEGLDWWIGYDETQLIHREYR